MSARRAQRREPARARARAARGVGLIEVLVATLVLSVGFLLIARMQVDAMASQRAAYHRSQALMLAGDMMDRMRNNLAGVEAGRYSGKTTSGTLTEPACVAGGTVCGPSEIAQADLYEWSARLQSMRSTTGYVPLLPAAADDSPAVGTIGTPVDGVYPIELAWQENEGGTEVERTVELKFAP